MAKSRQKHPPRGPGLPQKSTRPPRGVPPEGPPEREQLEVKKGQRRPAHWKKPGPKPKPGAAARHRENTRAASRRYYDRNREALLAKQRLQRKNDGDRKRATEARYRAAHRQEIAARERARLRLDPRHMRQLLQQGFSVVSPSLVRELQTKFQHRGQLCAEDNRSAEEVIRDWNAAQKQKEENVT